MFNCSNAGRQTETGKLKKKNLSQFFKLLFLLIVVMSGSNYPRAKGSLVVRSRDFWISKNRTFWVALSDLPGRKGNM